MGRIVPATDATHGPFRKVAKVVEEIVETPEQSGARKTYNRFTKTYDEQPYAMPASTYRVVYEVLECGHRGETLLNHPHPWETYGHSWLKEPGPRPAGKKRRCYACRVPTCSWCLKPGEEGNPIVTHHRIYGWEIHEGCKAAYDADDAADKAYWAKVREENLARRRAAGEDV